MSYCFCSAPKGLGAEREPQHAPELGIHKHNQAHLLQPLYFLFRKTGPSLSHPLISFFEPFSTSSPINLSFSFWKACHLLLSSVSGMNRQRQISLPSLSLTAACNHLLAISNISNDSYIAHSISCPWRIPFTPSLALSLTPSLVVRCNACSQSEKVLSMKFRV